MRRLDWPAPFVYGPGAVRRLTPSGAATAALVLGLAALVGCGHVEYVIQLDTRVPRAISQAKRHGAERLAPYEYTAALEYLREAREQAARASYQRALEFGLKAEEMAVRADALAREKGQAEGASGPRTP